MKVLQINIFGNLSTGRIAVDIYKTLVMQGHEGIIAFARNTIAEDVPHIRIGNMWSVYADGVMTRLTDKAGFYSRAATKQLIAQIREYNPDIIHLHNIHGYYVNVEILFDYLKESGKPVVWTLHDCWAFTGHCCNFEASACDKWKTGCNHCASLKLYPASFRDNSRWNYQKKQDLFTGIDRLTLVTPSRWLSELVSESYMKSTRSEVIHNGVDIETFKPTYGDWRKRYGLKDKKIILGVAGTWTPTKGLADFVKLAKMLDESYQVVVVGVSKKQQKALPDNVIGIQRTYDSRELAEIYTIADYFFNPTYDDNFPNVNLEALGCGTPVITYKTGGSPEAIDEKSGVVVEKGDLEAVVRAARERSFYRADCIARANFFNKEKCYRQYIDLYKSIIRE